jgi:hypothetical protein
MKRSLFYDQKQKTNCFRSQKNETLTPLVLMQVRAGGVKICPAMWAQKMKFLQKANDCDFWDKVDCGDRPLPGGSTG